LGVDDASARRGVDELRTLSAETRESLLVLARGSIAARLHGSAAPDGPASPALDVPAGVFVTVKVDGQLRGCIGIPEPNQSLRSVVQHCALAAAFEDPRFLPLQANELSSTTLEVSVLSNFHPVTEPAEIVVGRHGLVVERGPHRGLLLPQVAVEHGWTVEQFLEYTCRKAGLPRDAWRNGATVVAFEAEVFGDVHAQA
jgi:AmmeMemoRadiSam system protein A